MPVPQRKELAATTVVTELACCQPRTLLAVRAELPRASPAAVDFAGSAATATLTSCSRTGSISLAPILCKSLHLFCVMLLQTATALRLSPYVPYRALYPKRPTKL